MSKEDIINYVMTTPGNPNRAVLTGMLDSIAGTGGGVVLATLNIISDTEATCSLSYDEIETELQKKIPVILSWAYKPDGAPFYLQIGSDFVTETTGTMRVKINEETWMCQSGNNWIKVQ